MKILGLNKTTLLDYPGHVAATLFTGGCNFRCPFCQNGDLVLSPATQSPYLEEEIFSFLKKRFGLLTGVCISGGEPTLQPDLGSFLAKIKELGYLIKLDTNGYQPEILKSLVRDELIDFVAMDIKNSLPNYGKTAGVTSFQADRICDSVDFLMSSDISYEFRTTVVSELHKEDDFISIGKWLAGCSAYYLQSYEESDGVINPGFHAYEKEALHKIRDLLLPMIPNTYLRGIE